MLADKQEIHEVLPRENTSDQTRMALPDFPKGSAIAVRHESEWRKALGLGDAFDIEPELLFTLPLTPAGSLAFEDCQDFAKRGHETVVCDSVKALREFTHHGIQVAQRKLLFHLGLIGRVPTCFAQQAVDPQCSGLGFSHAAGGW